jgi:hypothetical protein
MPQSAIAATPGAAVLSVEDIATWLGAVARDRGRVST